MTWDGFNFANGQATQTGVVVFGGYAGLAAPHHITLRHITFRGSLTGTGGVNDHAIYFSNAAGGPHDLPARGHHRRRLGRAVHRAPLLPQLGRQPERLERDRPAADREPHPAGGHALGFDPAQHPDRRRDDHQLA